MKHGILFLLLSIMPPLHLWADLVEWNVTGRRPAFEGQSFGEVGPYEIIEGIAVFAVDPGHPANRGIVDLELAPVNEDGKVLCESDFCVLKPVDTERGNGVIFYDVNNRGNKLALTFFNDQTGNANRVDHAGNGFLMRQGYTVVWSGWIAEILPLNHVLRMRAPTASPRGEPITGLIRTEMTANQPQTAMPIQWNSLHGSYEPTARGLREASLTWRLREADERIPIPRAQWDLQITRYSVNPADSILPSIELNLKAGFRPGYIYELIYEARGPVVQGLGFTVVRDLISWLRYRDDPANPMLNRQARSGVRYAYTFGISQSGRYLRDFLYQGFNADEQNRVVFDAMIPAVAGGGRGSFNHRFAQPTWTNMQHNGHSYPADLFPFTYSDSTDPFSGHTDGILRKSIQNGTVPKVFHIDSSAEYWSRSGSLAHTAAAGDADAPRPGTVRFYFLTGSQHTYAFPPQTGNEQNTINHLDTRPLYRALLAALDEWVRHGIEPPASRYPRIDDGTLADWNRQDVGFPRIPGIRYPEVIQQPEWFDYGPRFASEGIVSLQPPVSKGKYTVKAPKTDGDGNELAGIRLPELQVPIATYTGWNLRNAQAGAENELVDLAGSVIPFARDKRERTQTGDPRPSLEERYDGFDDYKTKYREAAERLIEQHLLLEEDLPDMFDRLEQRKDLFP